MGDLKLTGNKESFDVLRDIVTRLLPRWGYRLSDPPHSGGFALGDGSKERHRYQFEDSAGTRVFVYDYQKVNGAYKGELRTALPPEQATVFDSQAGPLLRTLSPEYAASNGNGRN